MGRWEQWRKGFDELCDSLPRYMQAVSAVSLRSITTMALNSRTAELISPKPSVVIRVINGNVLGRTDVGPSQKEAKKVHVSEPTGI